MQINTKATIFLAAIFSVCLFNTNGLYAQNTKRMKNLHDYKVETIAGDSFDLSSLEGKKVMIVNTASQCGLTPQYSALEELYNEMDKDKFVIIGFPSNDFAGQEPGTNEEIAAFCQKNYGVSFPMMSKIHVKGSDIHPLYSWLTKKSENGVSDHEVKWNFHKFLVDENGSLVKDVSPQTLPTEPEIVDWIQK